MPRKSRIFEYGGYYIGKTKNSSRWQRFWTNEKGNTDHRTLGTEDIEEAKERLVSWVHENRELKYERPGDVLYFDLLNRFSRDYIPTMASPKTAIAHVEIALDNVDAGLLVSDFGPKYQRELGKRFQELYGWSESYIKRIFATLQRVLTWALYEELIATAPARHPFKEGELKKRKILTLEQIAVLYDAAPEWVQAFIIGMLCTCARPGALLQLNRFRCDLDAGIIDLHPEGWPRTKKRNPIIPIADRLRPWIQASGNYLIQKNGKPIRRDTMGKMFNAVRDQVGLEKDITAYSLRHTIATELRKRRVPLHERQMMLGHSGRNITDSTYSDHFEPEELIQAVKAIDDFIEEIDRVAPRPIYPKTQVRVNRVLAETDTEFKDSEKVIKFNN